MFYSYDDNFFDTIIKPSITPPKFVFKYVWSVFFLLMFISFILVVLAPQVFIKYLAILVFFVQLSVNLYWTKVFFIDHDIKKAFLIAILLFILVALMIILFLRLSIIAGILQIPYLLWLGFACVLNKLILELNT